MLYLADNLAYFPFQSQDEPLFIIHHINTMISVNGTNLLQNFREVSVIFLKQRFISLYIFKIIPYYKLIFMVSLNILVCFPYK